MKNIAYLGSLLLLLSCGESANVDEKEMSADAEFIQNVEDTTAGETALIDTELEKVEPSGWNIDDYAEFFEDACIAENGDAIDWNDPNEECQLFYETKDINGGFVNVTGAMEGWIEYVMFRMADGRDLVCRMAVGCGPACDYKFNFYYCNGEEYSDAGDELFPWDEMQKHQEVMYQKGLKKYGEFDYSEDNQLRFVFPQKGTSMEVNLILGADEIEYPILKLGWNKTNFFIEELYNEIKEAY